MKDLFDYRDYRSYLREIIAHNKQTRGYQSMLARAAGCQASYFSQILNSHVQLSLDQAANLCEFWHFDALETEYFIQLVQKERSSSPVLRRLVDKRIQEIKDKRFKWTVRQQGDPEILGADHSFFFSHWIWSVLYVSCSIPKFQNPTKLAEKIGMPLSNVIAHLEFLADRGLLKVGKNDKGEARYAPTEHNIALGDDSWVLATYHASLRQLAIEKISRNQHENELCYSYVHALSREDANHVKEILMKSLKSIDEIVRNSNEEEAYLFCCDFLPL